MNENENVTISIYPNPSNGLVNIKSNGSIRKIQVLNSLGQTIYTQSNTGTKPVISLDLSDFSGVYIIRMTDANGQQMIRKIILR